MYNLDELKLSVFGKQPHEQLTQEEEFSLQAVVASEEPTDYIPDLDDPETRATLSSLWEHESRKEERWQRFKVHILNPFIRKEKLGR
jgi:hypothetical protein